CSQREFAWLREARTAPADRTQRRLKERRRARQMKLGAWLARVTACGRPHIEYERHIAKMIGQLQLAAKATWQPNAVQRAVFLKPSNLNDNCQATRSAPP